MKSFRIVNRYLNSAGINPLNVMLHNDSTIEVIVEKIDISATKIALKHAIGSYKCVKNKEQISFIFPEISVMSSKFINQ